ncbi:MAG: BrnA antitoxin family protein [Acidobacteriota bacterium]
MEDRKPIKPKKRLKEGQFEVTEAEYRSSLAKGLDEETLLKPGPHKFVRGGFKQSHPDYSARTAKVKISIYLDKDILNHFRVRAEQAHAAAYQTQINDSLREVMERDRLIGSAGSAAQATALIQDSGFIAAVARQVAVSLKQQSKARQRTKAERLRS